MGQLCPKNPPINARVGSGIGVGIGIGITVHPRPQHVPVRQRIPSNFVDKVNGVERPAGAVDKFVVVFCFDFLGGEWRQSIDRTSAG
jgi:hypothetical protein